MYFRFDPSHRFDFLFLSSIFSLLLLLSAQRNFNEDEIKSNDRREFQPESFIDFVTVINREDWAPLGLPLEIEGFASSTTCGADLVLGGYGSF